MDQGDLGMVVGTFPRLPLLFIVNVYEVEPAPAEHPLFSLENTIVTPHVAWASNEAMQTLWDQVISHIDNFNAGKPSNRVA